MKISDPQRQQEYYRALVARDASYLGSFIAGVTSTGIFCLPTCRARKPKPENVDFYLNVKHALAAGFRPCKICRPMAAADAAPDEVTQALALFHQDPGGRVRDADLRAANLSPTLIRRWFKRHHGMTFQAYQRMVRINAAYHDIHGGKAATTAALDNGYESLSGFAYSFKRFVGTAPRYSGEHSVINLERVTTPLGPMYIGATRSGVCMVEFVDRRMLETEFAQLQKALKAPIVAGENDHIVRAKRELEEYFAGERIEFTFPLLTPGTPFQRDVWQALLRIPYGGTASYQDQARLIGRERAVRAVASANGANRVAIVVPCHRVIGKNGTLTGYGGGLERKRWLLEHEAKVAAERGLKPRALPA